LESIIALLNGALLTEDLDGEDRGWAYWNISDCLAILRRANSEHANHKRFEHHVVMTGEKYLHWPVCDGTQKLTLYIGGHGRYWDELYRHACEKALKLVENQVMRFESHRAAVAGTAIREYPYDPEISHLALLNMKEMLDGELVANYNYDFCAITYFTLLIDFYARIQSEAGKQALDDSFAAFSRMEELLISSDPNELDDSDHSLIGSWQYQNGRRSKFRQARVGIINYIHALIDSGNYQMALDCFERTKTNLAMQNAYFKNKIEFAKTQVKA